MILISHKNNEIMNTVKEIKFKLTINLYLEGRFITGLVIVKHVEGHKHWNARFDL